MVKPEYIQPQIDTYFAVGKCTADARRETRSCISILQTSRNKADAVKSSDQKGEQKQFFIGIAAQPIGLHVTHDENRILCLYYLFKSIILLLFVQDSGDNREFKSANHEKENTGS